MTIFGLIDAIKNARATLRDWREYRRDIGRWPLLSMMAHSAYFVVLVALAIWLIPYSSRHAWSRSRFFWTLILIVVPYMIVWSWLDRKIELKETRDRRHLSSVVNRE